MFKYRGKSKVYFYKAIDMFDKLTAWWWNWYKKRVWWFRDLSHNSMMIVDEDIRTTSFDLLLNKQLLGHEGVTTLLNLEGWANVLLFLGEDAAEYIWELFRWEKVGRYELWYNHYSFTGVIWTFLDWNYMRLRKCFKFCEYSNWIGWVLNACNY